MMQSALVSQKARTIAKALLQASPKHFFSSAGAAGNRLSGRSRFYKEVGVESLVTPPWDEIKNISSSTTAVDEKHKIPRKK